MKTYSMKPSEVQKKWFVVDAEGLVLGRLASILAYHLRGKHKPGFTTHIDCGDNFIVINAEKVKLTGKKLQDKIYHRHTGFPGGIKSQTAGEILEGRHSDRVIMKAVQRMLPKGPLGRDQLKNLRVFSGPEHNLQAQKPEIMDIAAMNEKNAR